MTLVLHHGVIAAASNVGGGVPVFTSGLSMSFNGIDENVDCGTEPGVQFGRLNPFSITAWVKPAVDGVTHQIISNSLANPDPRGFQFFVDTDGTIGSSLTNSATNGISAKSVGTVFAADGWTNVGFSYDGSGQSLGLTYYINGRDAGFTSTANTLSLSPVSVGAVLIGKRDASFANQTPFAGNIDEVAIFSAALADRDFAEIYSCGQSSNLSRLSNFTSATHWWRMGEGDIIP